MSRNILLKTNLKVCVIIVVGFIITSCVGYQSNLGIFKRDVEYVTDLTSESICRQIDSIFTRPMDVSLTMANDSLLKDFLKEKGRRMEDAAFLQGMRNYLSAYQKKYSYDSVFFVSVQNSHYYHFNGVDRILDRENPENTWYYDFLKDKEECSINIDNDEAAQDQVTAFVNCKVSGQTGEVMGVVGVGLGIIDIQELLRQYEDKFGVRTYLINDAGKIEVSAKYSGYDQANLFENGFFEEIKPKILTHGGEPQKIWHVSEGNEGYVVSKYIPHLKWHLVVSSDTSELSQQLSRQFYRGILIISVIILLVLFIITSVIRKYNQRIIYLTLAKEKNDYAALQEAANLLYETIYEFDITHNCAAGKSVKHYFKSLGISASTSYDEALKIIAQKQIKEEFRQGYLDTFSRDSVLAAYEEGKKLLTYEFMFTSDGTQYCWMRIIACIFYWEDDRSVRMTAYRQNIDIEKRRESYLFEQVQSDLLTKLYNKMATQKRISELIVKNPAEQYAFFILDVDNFKQINDNFGHAAGDFVLAEFASVLKRQFCAGEIVGRIGGDEFVAFVQAPSREWLERKARLLVLALNKTLSLEGRSYTLSSSVGIALYPDGGADFESLYKNADTALYRTKRNGKNGFTIYEPGMK